MTYYRILNKNNTVGLSLEEQKLLPLKKYEVSRLFRGHGAQLLTFCVLYCWPLLVFLSIYLSAIVFSVPHSLYHYMGYLYQLVHNSRLVLSVLIFQNKTSISLTFNNFSMAFCKQVHHELLMIYWQTLSYCTCTE